MAEEMGSNGDHNEITRREALRKGAALSSLIWAPPVISSIQMAAGTASDTSPPPTTTTSTSTTSTSTTSTSTTTTTIPDGPDISFIGLQISCGGGPGAMGYTVKYEGCAGDDCFESDPGNFPKCNGFDVVGQPADGDDLGFLVEGPDASGCVTIHVPAGCTVLSSVVKGGQCCETGPTGSGALVFCKPAPC